MQKTIIIAPEVRMKEFNSLFIEMTAHNCNMQCKHCYIDFQGKKIKDFIPIDKVKTALNTTKNEGIKYIHLTGAEPMLHPDFNSILRLCLKFSSVCIHTNGTMINDKKASFLRKVEDEKQNDYEIIFRISLDYYKEEINDSIRGRGAFRKSIHAMQSLVKYGFNPILTIVNHFSEDETKLKQEFSSLCRSFGFETEDLNFKIVPLFKKATDCSEVSMPEIINTDCSRSRTLTLKGIYTCPLMANDNRGLCGTNLEDYSKKSYVESPYCMQCMKNNKSSFCFDW